MIHEFKFNYNKDYNEKILWANDVHLDSVYCKRDLFIEHCEQADKIVLSGDFWDLMEGKFDRRQSIKDPALTGHYINKLVEMGVKILKPFKHKIIAWNKGNHELSFEKYSDVSITDFVCKELQINPVKFGMSGYYIFSFKHENDNINARNKTVLYFTHNTGMSGRRSKGSLAADIIAGERPSANIWVGEHSHRGVIVPLKIEKLNHFNNLNYELKYFCQSLTYKAADEDLDGNSFEILKGVGLLPNGGLIFEFNYNKKTKNVDYKVNFAS